MQSISKTELETSRKPTFRKGQHLLVSTRRNRPALTKNIDGAFDGIIGVVDEIDTENNMVRVIISMLGRETPVELELDQVEKQQ